MPSLARRAASAAVIASLLALAAPARAEPTYQSFVRDRQNLLTGLAAWSAGSVLVGTALLTNPSSDPMARYAGVQSIAWGAIDGAIAGFGLWGAQKSVAAGGAGWIDERRSMAKIFFINAALDVAYIAVGAALWSFGKTPALRGSGAGIVPQGGFLLLFDTLGGVVMSIH